MSGISFRRICRKGSVVLPLAFVYYIFLLPVSIYIPQADLYLNYGPAFLLLLSLTLLWLCLSPLRRGCAARGWSAALFHLVPVECFLMLVFAQWHFAVALLLGAALLAVDLLLLLAVLRGERLCPRNSRRSRQNRAAAARFSVLAAALLCAVPCLLAVFRYDLSSPTYEMVQEILEDLLSTEAPSGETEGDLLTQNRPLLEHFREETWAGYSVEEKITLLQRLGDLEAQRLGVQAVPVRSQKLSDQTLASYDWSTQEIWIDLEHLAGSTAEACITSLCHESFHSFQCTLLNTVDWDSELMQSVYFSELRAWRDNASHYEDGNGGGYDAYARQPLEDSAFSYAGEETARILAVLNS